MDEQRTRRGGSHLDRQNGAEYRQSMRQRDHDPRRIPVQTNYCQPSHRKKRYPDGDGRATRFSERWENSSVSNRSSTGLSGVKKSVSLLGSRSNRKGISSRYDVSSDSDSDADDHWSDDRRGANRHRHCGIEKGNSRMRRRDRGSSSKENFSEVSEGPFEVKEHGKRSGRNRASARENFSDHSDGLYETKRDENRLMGRRHGYIRKSSSSQGGSKGHNNEPEKYERLTCSETFMAQFDICAEFSRWKLASLKWLLKGSTTWLLWDSHNLSYRGFVSKSRSRFDSAGIELAYQAELQCRKHTPNEPLRELAQDIRRLVTLSYPGDKSLVSEHFARQCFISALEDPELILKVRKRKPQTLNSALKIAMRLERFTKAERQRRYHSARQASSSDEI